MKGCFSPHNPWRAYAWRIATQIQRTAPAEEMKHLTFVSSNLQNTKLLHYRLWMKEMEGKELGQSTQDPQKIKTCHSTMERRIFKYASVVDTDNYDFTEDPVKTAQFCIPKFSEFLTESFALLFHSFNLQN